MAGLPQEGDRPAEHDWSRSGRRGAVRRLDRRRPKRVDDERARAALHAPAEGQHWSAVNVEKVAALTAEGRMRPAGIAAFEAPHDGEHRDLLLRAAETVLTDDETARFRADAAGLGGLAGTLAVVSADRHPLGHERQARRDTRAAAGRAHRRFTGGHGGRADARGARPIVITDPAVATHEALAAATERLAALDLGDAFEPRAAEAIVATGLHRLVVPAAAGGLGARMAEAAEVLMALGVRRWLDGAGVRDAGPRRRGAGRRDRRARTRCATGCSLRSSTAGRSSTTPPPRRAAARRPVARSPAPSPLPRRMAPGG